jgi:hypothetical protein
MTFAQIEFFSYSIEVPWYVAAGILLALAVFVVVLARKSNGRR